MKRLLRLAAAVLLVAALATACTSRTKYGECLGLQEDELKDPKLNYRVSVLNVVLAVIFVETLVVPLVVALSETTCPVGPKFEGAAP